VELLRELAGILQRPRLKKKYGLKDQEIATFIKLLSAQAIPVLLSGRIHVCRDPFDNMVIETALVGKAEILVTRDDGLKDDSEVIRYLRHHGVSILSVNRFVEKYAL